MLARRYINTYAQRRVTPAAINRARSSSSLVSPAGPGGGGSPHHYTQRSRYAGWMPGFLRRHIGPNDLRELVEGHSGASAPGARGPLSETPVTQTLPFFGPISQSYDRASSTVTNQTQPAHRLHSGQVQQRYNFDNFTRETVGSGTGPFPALNNLGAPFLWGPQPVLRSRLYGRAISRFVGSFGSGSGGGGDTAAE